MYCVTAQQSCRKIWSKLLKKVELEMFEWRWSGLTHGGVGGVCGGGEGQRGSALQALRQLALVGVPDVVEELWDDGDCDRETGVRLVQEYHRYKSLECYVEGAQSVRASHPCVCHAGRHRFEPWPSPQPLKGLEKSWKTVETRALEGG